MALSDLPTELIHRIASFCEFEDIQALTCTSRALHSSCNDPFVFQALFCRTAPKPSSQSVLERNALAHLINAALATSHPTTKAGPPSPEARIIWSHLAFAAPKLSPLCDELDELMNPYRAVSFQPAGGVRLPTAELMQQTRSLLSVFSAFAVLGYVPAIDLGVAAATSGLFIRLTDPHSWSNHLSEAETGLLVRQQAFCLALGLLQFQVLNNMGVMTYHLSIMASWNEDRTAFYKFKKTWEGRQTIAIMAQAMLAHLLRSSLSGRSASEYLPSPERLPFATLRASGDDVVLPLPAPDHCQVPRRANGGGEGSLADLISAFSSTDSWGRWNRAYARRLAAQMDEGEWYGYFTWDTARNETAFLETGPIENIRFKVGEKKAPEESVGGDVFEVTADDCKEPAGSFAFEGEFFEESSSVVLRKIHPDGSSYNFRGYFTPLGIAGTLDPSPWGMPGWFWLWKREWMSEAE